MYQKRILGRNSCNSSTFTGRKGQVTIFIILGILLLLGVALIIVLRKDLITLKPSEIVPTEKGKIEQFITNCISSSGEEALFQMGLQGGYVNVPTEIAVDGSRHLKLSPFIIVPYWAYGKYTQIPSLQFMEEEIDNYLEKHVRECLLGQKAFQETYTIVEKSPLESDTKITRSQVAFNVHWVIEIRDKLGEVITELSDHTAESDVKLKRIHETASKIIEQEMASLKFEDLTQDLIALEHPKVPVAGLEISCSRKRWNANEAKTTLQDMLRVNLRQVKVSGTDYVNFPEEFPYYQNHYIWDVGESFHQSDIGVIFQYDNSFPFLFQVTPSDGISLHSSSLGGTGAISKLCIQNWKFTYDLNYPVLARIKDLTTNYDFNLPFTVHIVRNMPNREDMIVARPSAFLNFATDERYCSDRRIPMSVTTWEVVDNDRQGIYDQQPLEEVNVSFTCIKYRCDLGQSETYFATRGYQADLSVNFPPCAGGILRGTKEGYKETWENVVTAPGKQVELSLAPLFTVPAEKVSVRKHLVSSEDEIGTAQELDNDDTVFIQVITRRKDDHPDNPFHESSMLLANNLDPEIVQEEKLELLAKADFTYELKIDVFNQENFIGGYRGNWTVPWEEVQQAQKIIFHVASPPSASEEISFGLLSTLEQKSALIPQPELR